MQAIRSHSRPPTAPPRHGLVGTGILIDGRYELVERAAEGGMAAVWRANIVGAEGFRRPVAIKRILPTQNDEQFVKMFVEEARVCSQLRHPNIVQVFDFGRDDEGMYYLVMEWIEGVDLNQYTAIHRELGLPIPWPLVASIGIAALRGLRAAHERIDSAGRPAPVIHRDVTPSNILLDTNGVVRLTDFGVSRALDRASWTSPDVVKGKLAYMAPEIFADRNASTQSDMFSLGVGLWEALAGRRLYTGTDVEIFMAAKEAAIPPLAQLRADLPESLARVVERSLLRQPDERFPSANEMLRELSAAAQDAPVDEETLAQSVRGVLHFRRQRETESTPRSAQLTVPGGIPAQDPTEQVFYLTRRKKR
jgi:serine/threonine protein kinase